MNTKDALYYLTPLEEAHAKLHAAGWTLSRHGWQPPAPKSAPMTRSVLYSWGKLYFPWGIEDMTIAQVVPGTSIADPLSGRWECAAVRHGANQGFDTAVFQYVPATPYTVKEKPTADIMDCVPNDEICFNADGTLAPPVHPAWRDADPYPVGPETMPVNYATPEERWLRADFVLKEIERRIDYARTWEEAESFRNLKCKLDL